MDPDEIQSCNSPSSQNQSCEQFQRQQSCVDDCSHGTNSPSCCCSQKTQSSASGSERDADSLACVYPRSGSVIDSPVTIEVTEQTSDSSGTDVQTKSSNGPSISFGCRKRSYSINCNVLTPDAESEHDREDHESSFEWWFHRRKSSHKSRYRMEASCKIRPNCITLYFLYVLLLCNVSRCLEFQQTCF